MPAGHAILGADLDAYENATAAWQTWSPTLTNLTVGNGGISASYRQVGKTVDFRFIFVLGSTSAVGTAPTFTVPVAMHAAYTAAQYVGGGTLFDAGTAVYVALLRPSSSTVMGMEAALASGTYVGSSQITATAPYTFTTSDVISAWGTYEAA